MRETRLDPTRSAERVYNNWSFSQCSRKPVNQEEGKGWCTQHTPSLVKAKREERARQWRREHAAKERGWALDALKDAIAEAALEWDAAVEGPAELVNAIKAYRELEAKPLEVR